MKTLKSLILCLIVILGVSSNALAAPLSQATLDILYVKVTGTSTNSCYNWTDACDLQTALTNSVSGNEIRVASGTYKPTAILTDRTATFRLKSGVAVYGGFAGTETQLDQRDWEANPTILSGDLNGDDAENFANNSDNSYHVVTASGVDATTILDGFTITGGNTNSEGGGMYNKDSSPTLSNLIFTNNKGAVGGGMYNENGSPILTNITFYRNDADAGGGMFNRNGKPTLTNVTFSENTTNQLGGGMHNEDSSPTLTNVTFSRNKAIDYGGGMCNVANNGTTNPKLTNVTFFQNEAGKKGGGIVHIAYTGLPNPIAESTIINAIFWGNTNGQIVDNVGDPTTVTNSIVQDGCPTGVTFTDIITDDPKLDSILADNGGFSMTHALQAGSPAIDAGNSDPTICPATDQRGYTRPIGAGCDIGAYEFGYTLKVIKVGNGSVAANPDQAHYSKDQVVTLTATADTGWTFLGWSGDVTGTVNQQSVSLSGNQTITATFNRAPLANAGADQSVKTMETVTLDGTGSTDPDGDTPLTCQWAQTAGTSVALDDPTAGTPTFTAPSDPGSLTFSLVVRDSLGLASLVDEVTIAVSYYLIYLPVILR